MTGVLSATGNSVLAEIPVGAAGWLAQMSRRERQHATAVAGQCVATLLGRGVVRSLPAIELRRALGDRPAKSGGSFFVGLHAPNGIADDFRRVA
jgi:hypothetical protein